MKSLTALLDAFDFIQGAIEDAAREGEFRAVNLLTEEAIYLAEELGHYGVDPWAV